MITFFLLKLSIYFGNIAFSSKSNLIVCHKEAIIDRIAKKELMRLRI